MIVSSINSKFICTAQSIPFTIISRYLLQPAILAGELHLNKLFQFNNFRRMISAWGSTRTSCETARDTCRRGRTETWLIRRNSSSIWTISGTSTWWKSTRKSTNWCWNKRKRYLIGICLCDKKFFLLIIIKWSLKKLLCLLRA